MHSKSGNIAFMIYDNVDGVIAEIFESLLSRYPIGLETSIRGSDIICDYVRLLYYKCHKINVNFIRSYTDSPDWIKNKRTTINLINKNDNKCFQYARSSCIKS